MAVAALKGAFRARMGSFFGAHGRFCASHPWEVIVTTVTLTVCVLSMGLLSGVQVGVCGINRACENEKKEEASDVMLSIVNILAVVYVYHQFSSLRKAGSKYLLGTAGMFTIFASFVFGTSVVNLINDKISGLSEALPFYLLLIDLSKASALAKFAFRSRNKHEGLENIGRGMAELGPNMTLDTLVEVLLIGIGTISGVQQLEMICAFGCMSIVANYLVFMTFFPAALALVLEVYDPTTHVLRLDGLAWAMEEEQGRKSNPVVQRIKVIMAVGLVVVHLHSRFLSNVTGLSLWPTPSLEGGEEEGGEYEKMGETENIPIPEYLWWKAFNLSVDQLITLILATVLFVKYIFFDKSETFPTSVPPTPVTPRAPPSLPHSSPSCPFVLDDLPDSLMQTRRRRSAQSLTAAGFDGSQLNPTLDAERLRQLLQNERSSIVPRGPVANSGSLNGKLALPVIDENDEAVSIAVTSSNKTQERSSDMQLDAVRQYATVSVQTDKEEEITPKSSGFVVGATETVSSEEDDEEVVKSEAEQVPRPLEQCVTIYKSESGAAQLTDTEVLQLVEAKHIPSYKLETAVGDPERGVAIRRQLIQRQLSASGAGPDTPITSSTLEGLPYTHYDYSRVMGACCENVVGYTPVPVGVAGPLILNETPYFVPMATTEGCLVASTNRGCRAVSSCGGVRSYIINDGMTRGPVIRLKSAAEASSLKLWLEEKENFASVEEVFNSTSNYARLKSVHTAVAGRLMYVRFKATTGDAMGMNMLSKAVEKALEFIQGKFPSMEILSLSGNYCTDKKPAAINWLEGRGKSVVCEATIPAHVVTKVLKTTVDALVDLNISKNLVGSAMAGSIGGFNAHAANIVTAIFIATGQDPAQNIASSNCITLMEKTGPKGEDLYMSCTMPSVEVGTVGGGTVLPAQSSCLKLLGLQGSNTEAPGKHASLLAQVVCATVLCGELSLISALAAGHLVRSHLTHNRSQLNLASIPESPQGKSHKPPKRTVSAPSVGTCISTAS